MKIIGNTLVSERYSNMASPEEETPVDDTPAAVNPAGTDAVDRWAKICAWCSQNWYVVALAAATLGYIYAKKH